jgi:hypothetical protein
MYSKTLSGFFAVAGFLGLASSIQAQYYVPHTTTHIDQVRHGNHYHNVPHTTTHYHALPNTYSHYGSLPYGSRYPSCYGGHQSYRPKYPVPTYSPYRSTYQPNVPRTSMHLDIVPHRGHYHIVPHTGSHGHRH